MESIYNLIPREEVRAERKPRYEDGRKRREGASESVQERRMSTAMCLMELERERERESVCVCVCVRVCVCA